MTIAVGILLYVAPIVIGLGFMGLIRLLDGYGSAVVTAEQQEIDDSLREIRRLHDRLDAAYRQGDYGQADLLSAELDERTAQIRAKIDSALGRAAS